MGEKAVYTYFSFVITTLDTRAWMGKDTHSFKEGKENGTRIKIKMLKHTLSDVKHMKKSEKKK